MISKISARNFLSYADVSVEFDKDSRIINITGDNGAGKSSFLEIIPFALFGESRVPFDSLVKSGEDGLWTSVEIDNEVPGPVKIVRQRKRSEGSSKLTVEHFDNVTKEGPFEFKNKEATDFLSEFFGTDYFIFSLTSYFGMGAGDSLVLSGAKTRIGYLQRIANISIYLELAKRSSAIHRTQREKMQILSAAVGEMKFTYETEYEDLDGQIEEGSEKVEQLEHRKEIVSKELTVASSGRERIYHLTVEKKKLERALVGLREELKLLKAKLLDAKGTLEAMREEKALTLKETVKVTKFLKKYSNGLARIDRKLGSLRARSELLQFGVHNYEDDGCPLCGSEVGDELIDVWQSDLEEITTMLNKLTKFRETIRRGVKVQKAVKYEYVQAKNSHDYTDLEVRTMENDVQTRNLRLDKITSEIREFYDNTKLNVLEKELSDINNSIANIRAAVGLSKKKKHRAEVLEERIADKVQQRNRAGLKMDVANILTEVFSQKGIPLQLLRDICAEIEIEATSIFQEFDQGEIVVRGLDAEDGKLDVSFHLDSSTGLHHYNQLSAGQRTLVLLSVRLALSKICFRNNPQAHLLDFVVLDEVTGNLSDNKIESLTRVIARMVNTTFSQVFIISHAAVPNLQPDVTLSASLELGDSILEVV